MRCRRLSCVMLAASLCVAAFGFAAEGPAVTDPAQAGPDFAVQGEYLGEIKTDDGAITLGAQVIALGEDRYHVVVFHGGLPGEGWEGRFKLETQLDIYPGEKPAPDDWVRGAPAHQADGKLVDGVVTFEGPMGKGTIRDGQFIIVNTGGVEMGRLKHVERKSPTLGATPPAGAEVLFDGSTADGWEGGRLSEEGYLVAGCKSKATLRDFTLHLEFRTPYMPAAREQGRGNSGMYLQDRYEVQVLDSFGLEGRYNECSGIYSISAPKLNMCLPPLSWQTYDVEFTAAKFDDQKNKTASARATIRFNGVPIHEDLELPQITAGGGASEEYPGEGPIYLQDHSNPVYYRNIWVVRK